MNTLDKNIHSNEILLENKSILTPIRVQILRSICMAPKTAYSVSKELKLHVSTIYRNLDVLSAYNLIMIYSVEPYKQVTKKYYMPSLKGFFGVYGYLSDLARDFFYYYNKYIFSRWGFMVDEARCEKYAILSSNELLLKTEFNMLKPFLETYGLTLDDLNELMAYLSLIIYIVENIDNMEVKKLETKRIAILAEIAKEKPEFYNILERRILFKSQAGLKFLNMIKELMQAK